MSVFTILHVCVGNICRSPMAERLLVTALREHVGDRVDDLYRSHGAGTGMWHVGEAMNPPAATEVRRRGSDPGGFAARYLTADLIDESDLVLCATGEQVARVLGLRPGPGPARSCSASLAGCSGWSPRRTRARDRPMIPRPPTPAE